MNLQKVRKHYPITQNYNYLNYAATSPISNGVVDAIQSIARKLQQPISKNADYFEALIKDTRHRLGKLINVPPTSLAFANNTSSALSIIAHAINFKSGDKILAPTNEFPSNRFVWQSLEYKNVTCELFELKENETIVDTLNQLDLSSIKLISVSAVSYLTGRLYELEALSNFCKSKNILLCLDAIQAIGAIPLDVGKIAPDFIACGAQKWLLGGAGTGFFYINPHLLDQLNVPLIGWASAESPKDFSAKPLELAKNSRRFEPGLSNFLCIAGLNQSLKELTKIGWDTIYQRVQQHTQYLQTQLTHSKFKIMAASHKHAGITSCYLPKNLDSKKLFAALEEKNIIITCEHDYIRIAPHFYNTQDELDELLNILEVR